MGPTSSFRTKYFSFWPNAMDISHSRYKNNFLTLYTKWWTGKSGVLVVHGVAKSRTWMSDWTETEVKETSFPKSSGLHIFFTIRSETQWWQPHRDEIMNSSSYRLSSFGIFRVYLVTEVDFFYCNVENEMNISETLHLHFTKLSCWKSKF